MTCTIHYRLSSKADSPAEAKQLLECLRQRAKALPFDGVSEMFDLNAQDWQKAAEDKCHPLFGIAKRATLDPDRIDFLDVAPERTMAFRVATGKGCEPAVFGLRRWSDAEDWGWHGFCKTFFALEVSGGHFLRQHLQLIRLLDHAADLGLLNEVKDEAGFWDHRDVRELSYSTGVKQTRNHIMSFLTLESLLWPKPIA